MSNPETPGTASAAWRRLTAVFLTSQTISLFGSSLVQYAIVWYITLTAKSGALQTIAILSGFLPTLLMSPFAGVWADRYSRRRLMVLADGGIALVTLLVALVFQTGYQELWVLFAALAVRAAGQAVHSPALNAFVPQIVPAEFLVKVNGMNQGIQSAVMIVSPILAAALLSVAPLQTIFWIDVGTAALAISILLLGVRVPHHPRQAEANSRAWFYELAEGVRYVRRHPFVFRFLAFCAVFFVLVAPVSFLTPLQVARSFGPEVWRLSAIEVVFAAGMMLGGLALGLWGGFRNRVHTMIVACAMFALCTIGLGLIPDFVPYLIVMGLCGLGLPLFNAPSTSLLQEQVDPAFLGRVFSVMSMITSVSMPLGMVVFGPLADVVPIATLLVISGGGMLAMTILLLLDREFHRHGLPVAGDQASHRSS